MLRIGLAGLGIHGMRYANHLLGGDVAGAVLSVVSRRDRYNGERFAREKGLLFVADPLALAAHHEVDAVSIAVLPDMHAELVEACITAGKPVLVEKPLAATAREAARVAGLVELSGVPVMVAQTLRYDSVVQKLRQEIGSVGDIHMVSINQHFESDSRSWIDDPGRGGALLNTAVHGLDLLRYLTGAEPVSVMAETGRARTKNTEDILSIVVRLEPGGIIGHVENARSTEARSGRIEIVGSEAMLKGDHIHRTAGLVIGRHETDLGSLAPCRTVPLVLGDFVNCLENGYPMPVTADDGRIAVEMAEAARLSADSGRRVMLSEVRAEVR